MSIGELKKTQAETVTALRSQSTHSLTLAKVCKDNALDCSCHTRFISLALIMTSIMVHGAYTAQHRKPLLMRHGRRISIIRQPAARSHPSQMLSLMVNHVSLRHWSR